MDHLELRKEIVQTSRRIRASWRTELLGQMAEVAATIHDYGQSKPLSVRDGRP